MISDDRENPRIASTDGNLLLADGDDRKMSWKDVGILSVDGKYPEMSGKDVRMLVVEDKDPKIPKNIWIILAEGGSPYMRWNEDVEEGTCRELLLTEESRSFKEFEDSIHLHPC